MYGGVSLDPKKYLTEAEKHLKSGEQGAPLAIANTLYAFAVIFQRIDTSLYELVWEQKKDIQALKECLKLIEEKIRDTAPQKEEKKKKDPEGEYQGSIFDDDMHDGVPMFGIG